MDENLKKLVIEILDFADSTCTEILIGIQLNSHEHRIFASNQTSMKIELLTDGLRFDEGDDLFEEIQIKAEETLEK